MTTPPMPPPAPPPAMPAPDGPRQRPVTVTAASGIMMLIGFVNLVSAGISIAIIDDATDKLRENAQAIGATDVTIDRLETFVTAGVVIGIVFSLLVVAVISVLALFNLRGNNVTRIITWVVSGLFLLCGVCSIFSQGLNSAFTGGGAGQELNQAAADVYPGWYMAVTMVVTILQSLCYVAVIVLLALPQSHPFFRKQPPAAFTPPVTG